MNLAAYRQAESYKNSVSRQSDVSEKEKYAQRIGDQNLSSAAIFTGGGES